MGHPGSIVVQGWTTRFRLVIDLESKQAKEAIQSDGGVAVKSNTPPNYDTGCRTSVVMHNATVQHPLTTMSPKLESDHRDVAGRSVIRQ
ncbi:hypothetical protein TNCV_1962211 [Trichonephila clavipes]|nr:hypothetical protein TNCV_1962211 [Trichonephila clavipes]